MTTNMTSTNTESSEILFLYEHSNNNNALIKNDFD